MGKLYKIYGRLKVVRSCTVNIDPLQIWWIQKDFNEYTYFLLDALYAHLYITSKNNKNNKTNGSNPHCSNNTTNDD